MKNKLTWLLATICVALVSIFVTWKITKSSVEKVYVEKLVAITKSQQAAHPTPQRTENATPQKTDDSAVPQKPPSDVLEDMLSAHPEYRAAVNGAIKQAFLNHFGDFRSLLNLDEQTYKKVADLLMQKLYSRSDGYAAAIAQGLKPGTPEFATTLQAQIDDAENQLRDALGQDKYDILNRYPAVLNSETQLRTTYAAVFATIGEPLTEDQISKMAPIMAMAGDPSEKTAPSPDNGYLTPNENAVLNEAKNVLSPAQLEAFKNQYVQRNMAHYFNITYAKGIQY